MRNLWISVLLLAMAACGGGGSQSIPPPVPFGTISGSTFDALIVGGTVKAYDFSAGVKGKLLGQDVSDAKGLYSLSVQEESKPILVEVTGGSYIEEAGAKAQVSLAPNHILSALVNYTTGSTTRACLTTYTHLAAGLATYRAAHGTKVADAVDDANRRVSVLAGVDILATIPASMIDAGSANSVVTPELQYGMLSGAISKWTYDHMPSTATQPHLLPFTSIDFARLVYQDIVADGLLDGVGVDASGGKTQLSFGSTPLGPDVYRLGLAISMLKMAGDKNNLTGIDGAALFSAAKAYAGNTDLMFAGVAPVSLVPPATNITTPTANIRVSGTISVSASEQSIIGLSKADLLVDGAVVGTMTTNLPTITFQLDTTAYVDGNHTVEVHATDWGGQGANSAVQLLIDNVAPAVTISSPTANSKLNGTVSVAATTQSVAGLTNVVLQLDGVTVATATNLAAPAFQLVTTAYLDGSHVIGIQATDIGGLVSLNTVQVTFANFVPVVTISTPTANTWGKGLIGVAATAQSTIGLSTVQLIVDGAITATATNLTAPSFTINTASYTDGAHTFAVRATDVNGLVTTSSVPVNIDNTPPTSTFAFGGSMCTAPLSGCASDNASGILSITDVSTGAALPLDANQCWTVTKSCPWSAGMIYPFVVKDKAGNCGNYKMDLNYGTTTLTSAGPC